VDVYGVEIECATVAFARPSTGVLVELAARTIDAFIAFEQHELKAVRGSEIDLYVRGLRVKSRNGY